MNDWREWCAGRDRDIQEYLQAKQAHQRGYDWYGCAHQLGYQWATGASHRRKYQTCADTFLSVLFACDCVQLATDSFVQ